MEKRLYRNEHDKVLAGVASGVADYLKVDVTIVRLLFVLSTIFLAGSGVVVYLVLWVVAPVNNDPKAKFKRFNEMFNHPFGQETSSFNNPSEVFNNPYQNPEQTKWNTPNADSDRLDTGSPKTAKNNNEIGKRVIGLILLVLGIYFLLWQLDLVPYWFNIFYIYKLWPLLIVALGISLIFKNKRKNEWEDFKKTTEEQYTKEQAAHDKENEEAGTV